MKCRYFREWALYGIKPVPTMPSVRQYWWPSVNSVKTSDESKTTGMFWLFQKYPYS